MRKEITYNKIEATGCWECTSHATDEDGYARMKANGKQCKIHRKFYELYNGPIPEGLVVRHTCDNPVCINPDHLLVGTQAENIQDCVIRGRFGRGHESVSHLKDLSAPKIGKRKLTDADVLVLRKVYGTGKCSHRSLARDFGVTKTTVSQILRRETWTHI